METYRDICKYLSVYNEMRHVTENYINSSLKVLVLYYIKPFVVIMMHFLINQFLIRWQNNLYKEEQYPIANS